MYIGAIAGVVCFFGISLKNKFGFDDSLDVIGVHLVGGVVGSLLLGLFSDKVVNSVGADGAFLGGGATLFTKHLIAVVATLVFSGSMTFIIAKVLDMVIPGGLRVSDEEEEAGLDLSQHSEVGYALQSQ